MFFGVTVLYSFSGVRKPQSHYPRARCAIFRRIFLSLLGCIAALLASVTTPPLYSTYSDLISMLRSFKQLEKVKRVD